MASEKLLIGAMLGDRTVLQSVDVVALREEVQGVGDQDDCLATVSKSADDGVGEESPTDVCVNRGKRVVEKDDVGIMIKGASNVDLRAVSRFSKQVGRY